MTGNFAFSTPRQKRDQTRIFGYTQAVAQFDSSSGRSNQTGKRVTYVRGRNPMLIKEFLFERKDAQQPVDEPAHTGQAALAPSPHLWRYQINDRNAEALELLRQAKVKIGAVCKNGHIGPLALCSFNQFVELAADSRNVRNDFNQANHGQTGGIDNSADPCFPHSRPSAAEKFQVRIVAAERFDEARGIEVARRLSSGDKHLGSHCNFSLSRKGEGATNSNGNSRRRCHRAFKVIFATGNTQDWVAAMV